MTLLRKWADAAEHNRPYVESNLELAPLVPATREEEEKPQPQQHHQGLVQPQQYHPGHVRSLEGVTNMLKLLRDAARGMVLQEKHRQLLAAMPPTKASMPRERLGSQQLEQLHLIVRAMHPYHAWPSNRTLDHVIDKLKKISELIAAFPSLAISGARPTQLFDNAKAIPLVLEDYPDLAAKLRKELPQQIQIQLSLKEIGLAWNRMQARTAKDTR